MAAKALGAAKSKTVAEEPRAERPQPWVEKYRPKKIDDVVHQDEVCATLRKVIEDKGKDMPHLLFYGPPGTGKTSTILAACRQLYGPKYFASRVKELNASDDRGIAVIRKKVKVFAAGAVGTNVEQMQNGVFYPVPPYKIIILDEADAMLPDAQACLRRVMEDYNSVTRFCIICNYVSRIIEPLVSRCAKFRFKPITREMLRDRIASVAKGEGLKIDKAGLARLDEVSGGDLRLGLQYLQGASRSYGKDLTIADWDDVAGRVPDVPLRRFYNSFWKGFADMQQACQMIGDGGYSAMTLVGQLSVLVENEDTHRLSDIAKGNILMKCSSIAKPLHDGADEMLQLLDLGGYAVKVINTPARKVK